MRDISDLRLLGSPRTWIITRNTLIVISVGSVALGVYYDLPLLMSAFLGVFFLLPLTNGKELLAKVRLACESYDGGQSHGATVRWIKDDSSDDTTWSADIDLGTLGRWTMKLGGERPVEKAKEDLPAVVTVWVHPDTKEPHLMKTPKGMFYAKSVTKVAS